jgi:putative ABC transport system ATP-binding protein
LVVKDLVVERREASPAGRRILDRVSLAVESGAVVAITGPSGAGKTTLLHAVAGIVQPDGGTVSWGSLDVTALPEAGRDRWRRGAVGLVFQDFQLLAELGVLENILLPVHFDHWRAPRAAVERAAMLADRVGLDHRGPRAGALSRGEQQRVAIARALMREPQLILADEPTASLDADNSARVIDLLIDCTREAEASVLLVSHDADLLRRASHVHRLQAGALQVDQGGPS